GRQHLRIREATGLRKEIREAVQGAARCQGRISGGARQSRRPEPALLQAVRHERRSVLHVQEGQRALLRVGQQLSESGAAQVARGRAAEIRIRLEDSLFSSSALFEWG